MFDVVPHQSLLCFSLKQELDIRDALRLILLIIQSNVGYVDEPGNGVTLGVNISTEGHEGVGPDAKLLSSHFQSQA